MSTMNQAQRGAGPWNDPAELETLLTYWAEHQEEFRDDESRSGIGFPRAAEVIKSKSGKTITTQQIGRRFVMEKTLETGLPDALSDRNLVAEEYEKLITELYGAYGRSIFRRAAVLHYVRSQRFTESAVVTKARFLSDDIGDTLWPLIGGAGRSVGHADDVEVDVQDEISQYWRGTNAKLEELFQNALRMRAELWLNRDTYHFFWPKPNSPFDPKQMRVPDVKEDGDEVSEDSLVQVTLFPRLVADDSRIEQDQGTGVADRPVRVPKNWRVISKTLVLSS
ncbi:MAG: hypothetical protein M1833_004760 [Piccolia ochrophora]|nr:MAG: hypothetical protein M1833_004760 [Piccolia ochrophora]